MTSEKRPCSPEVAKLVVYEMSMFNYLCDKLEPEYEETETFVPGKITWLGTGSSSDEDKQETFALLESLLLHTRVLHDFFYPNKKKKPRPDDVLASHFIPDWDTRCPRKPEYIGKQKKRLNKALAHLTTARLGYDSDGKKWNVTAIRNEMHDVIEQFIGRLPQDQKQWFAELL